MEEYVEWGAKGLAGQLMKLLLIIAVILMILPGTTSAQETVCVVYVTGIGCPHCTKVDPVLLEAKLQENPGLVMIEYEVYQKPGNAGIMLEYDSAYGTGFGFPLVIFGEDFLAGDYHILSGTQELIDRGPNPCPLPGEAVDFGGLIFSGFPGIPTYGQGTGS